MNFQKRHDNAHQAYSTGGRTAEAQIPRMVEGLAGAEAEFTKAKQNMTEAIQSLSRLNMDMDELRQRMAEQMEKQKREIDQSKEDVKQASEKVQQERTLNMIRKEQAETLAKKHAGNYHSSWMGLYRPLREGSRMVFLVLAVVFFLTVAHEHLTVTVRHHHENAQS
jgi:regulator of replication initiation timing